MGTGFSGDSSRSKGTRGRTRSRTSGPTGFCRRLRLRSDAMVASFSTGTSAKESTGVSIHPGVSCQGIRGGREGQKTWQDGQPRANLTPAGLQAFIKPETSSNNTKLYDYSNASARCKHHDMKRGHCPPVLPVLEEPCWGAKLVFKDLFPYFIPSVAMPRSPHQPNGRALCSLPLLDGLQNGSQPSPGTLLFCNFHEFGCFPLHFPYVSFLH